MRLLWKICFEDGEITTGEREWQSGTCRVILPLPEKTIVSAKANCHITISENDKIFMNGYQTWTFCPEYSTRDRMKNLKNLPKQLINKFHLDRYGDYHFVNYDGRKGYFHGFSYCYFRDGNRFRLFASLDERPGYTIFRVDPQGGLSIERDCAGVQATDNYHIFDLFYAEGSEHEVFDAWFEAMAKPKNVMPKLAGYTSWYNRYQNISEQTIVEDLEGCSRVLFPGDLFQIDDGWEPFVGDWLETDKMKFPKGLKPIVERTHEKGYKAGLWLAPFICEEKSELFKKHPEFLLQHDGKPWSLGCNWSGFYALDFDKEEVQDYLRSVFRRVFDEWGFDLVKLDFLYGAAPFGTIRESRAGKMIRALEFIRDLCGDKLILGCGVPVMPAFGLVDYCRISCDVGLDWDDKPMMRLIHRERVSTKQAILNTIFRRELNNRAHGNDPDVFFLREDGLKLNSDQKRILYTVNALFGSILLMSDNPATYTDEMMETYQYVRKLMSAKVIQTDITDRIRICYELDGKKHSLVIPQK